MSKDRRRADIPLSSDHAGAVEVPIRRFILISRLDPGKTAEAISARWNSKDDKIEASTESVTLHDTHILAGDGVTEYGQNFGLPGEQFTARKDIETGRWTCLGSQGLRRWGKASYQILPGGSGPIELHHDQEKPSCDGEPQSRFVHACVADGWPPVEQGDWVYIHYHPELKRWKVINSKSVVVGAGGLVLIRIYSQCIHPGTTGGEYEVMNWNALLSQYVPSGAVTNNLDDPAGRNFLLKDELVWGQFRHGRLEITGENGLTRRAKLKAWSACGAEAEFYIINPVNTCPDDDDYLEDEDCKVTACAPIPFAGTVGVELKGNSCVSDDQTILQQAVLQYIPQTKKWHVTEWIKPPDLWASVKPGQEMECGADCVEVVVESFIDGCPTPGAVFNEYVQKVTTADNPKNFSAKSGTRLHLKYDYSVSRYIIDDVVRECVSRYDRISKIGCRIEQRRYDSVPAFPNPVNSIEESRITMEMVDVMDDLDYNTLAGGTGECVADAEFRKHRRTICVFDDLGNETGAGVTNGWSNAIDLYQIIVMNSLDCDEGTLTWIEDYVMSPDCGEEIDRSDTDCCPE